jgi:hypothetical protein
VTARARGSIPGPAIRATMRAAADDADRPLRPYPGPPRPRPGRLLAYRTQLKLFLARRAESLPGRSGRRFSAVSSIWIAGASGSIVRTLATSDSVVILGSCGDDSADQPRRWLGCHRVGDDSRLAATPSLFQRARPYGWLSDGPVAASADAGADRSCGRSRPTRRALDC